MTINERNKTKKPRNQETKKQALKAISVISLVLDMMINQNTNSCSNCGEIGHSYRGCMAPVCSYGLIAFRINNKSFKQTSKLTSDARSLTGYEGQDIQFLLIQRKDSIGYVELIRGKYKPDDVEYISAQIDGMTGDERQRIITLPFDRLWNDMWGANPNSKQYTNEHESARKKIAHLRESGVLEKLINESKASVYTTPEWGFPKGRRNPREDNISCAMREFNEETGLRPYQYAIVENMEPLRETFFGSNHVHYTHIYYMANCSPTLEVSMKKFDSHMAREVGDIRWVGLEEALKLIRPDNVEKREVLLRASSILRNYCALQMGSTIQTGVTV